MTGNKPRDLRARNLDLFRRGVPEIHARLMDAGEAEQAADGDTGVPAAERTYTARFTVKAPTREDLDAHTFHFLQGTLRRATDAGIAFFDEPRSPETYFLVVVGAGDGNRLLAALQRIKPLCVIVVEPDAGALWRSFDSVDWNIVFRAVRARKGELHFMLEDDPDRVSANVWRVMRKTNPAAADGFTIVAHDHHDLARRLIRNLGDEAQLIVSGLGFFHDELLMLANAYRNLGAAGARVFKRTPDRARGLPALVIGSGPSLDWAIDAVKANAGKAIVISCGSALRPLIKMGILPDFQIEIENLNVSPLTAQVAGEHDVGGVILVTACTVDPAAVSAFDHVAYFFRKALSPYPLFCPTEDWSLPLPDPTVVNAGLSFAQATGFRDIYLFGVDFGSQLPYRHHAKDAFHHTPEAAAFKHVSYDIEVDANFGGICFTDRGLFSARDNAIEAIRAYGDGRRYFNCSDGVAIRGARPTRPENLVVAGRDLDKRAEVADIVGGFESGAALVGAWPGDAVGKVIEDYAGRLAACLVAIEDFSDKAFYQPLMKILRPQMGYLDSPERSTENAINIVFRGTLFGMLIFFDYYLSRVADPGQVNRFGTIARDELIRRVEALKELALAGLGGETPRPPSPTEPVSAAASETLPKLLRIGRNAACPCGSGLKYKRCHGKAD
jgi:hypothetical protein